MVEKLKRRGKGSGRNSRNKKLKQNLRMNDDGMNLNKVKELKTRRKVE